VGPQSIPYAPAAKICYGAPMSEFRTDLRWQRTTPDFLTETYNRAHEIAFGSGITIPASSAPAYKGDADRVNPEESLLAALSSCHMLTFLAIAAKKKLTVDRYVDHATCVLGKDESGGLSVTEAILRPQITFAAPAPSAEAVANMHESAHRNCFIARSVTTKVTIEAAP
jgi:organic hydroperoxide reductase OsmC/OhrA